MIARAFFCLFFLISAGYFGFTEERFGTANESVPAYTQSVYTDDATKMSLVKLDAKQKKTLEVTASPTVDQQTEKKSDYRHKNNYFSASAGLDCVFPINDAAEMMNIGYASSFYLNYNLAFTSLIISLGAYGGLDFGSTKNLYGDDFYLFSCPLGVNFCFRSNLNSPLMFFVEANSGADFNFIMFKEQSQSEHNRLVTKYFIMPSAGVGYYFNAHFGLFIDSRFLLIFYDNCAFQSVAAGIRCDFIF